MIEDRRIDHGKGFDWGRTSADYARYRNIYPQCFYDKLFAVGIVTAGQRVLDLGTGTGVLPRSMYSKGAAFTGFDISENQIEQAKRLSNALNMKITFMACSAETADFEEPSFDVVTACQCFHYFNHDLLAPKIHRWLADNGRLAIMFMNWLPLEDKVAEASERLVLKYNPKWTGGNETRHEIAIPESYYPYFEIETSILFDVLVPFTRESWNGRMKSCRGIGASLSDEAIGLFENEHIRLLKEIVSESFDVLHYCAITVLKRI